jgi:ParB family transcriptional regulator, chromosome partitioning protein
VPAPSIAAPVSVRYKPATLYKMPLDSLKPDPDQARIHFSEDALEALAASLRRQGVIQPVLFRLDDQGEATLVAGERRWRAARQAGLKTIPGLCITGDPLELSMVEYTLREELTAVELAEALGRLKEQRSYTLEQLATLVGKALSTVSEILSLTRLPREIRDECRTNQAMPRDILVRIARAETPEEMIRLFSRYRKGLTDRQQLKTMDKSGQPLKFSAVTRHLTTHQAKLSAIDVISLKPAQRKKLKPLLQTAIKEMTTLLKQVEDEQTRERGKGVR